MALDDKPWWGKKDTLYGGETFTSLDDRTKKLGIAKNDRFRVEKKGINITMTPHPQNQGTLRDSDNQMDPIKMNEVEAPKFTRAYKMEVTVTLPNELTSEMETSQKEFFFIEQKNAITVIANRLDLPETDEGVATVER